MRNCAINQKPFVKISTYGHLPQHLLQCFLPLGLADITLTFQKSSGSLKAKIKKNIHWSHLIQEIQFKTNHTGTD